MHHGRYSSGQQCEVRKLPSRREIIEGFLYIFSHWISLNPCLRLSVLPLTCPSLSLPVHFSKKCPPNLTNIKCSRPLIMEILHTENCVRTIKVFLYIFSELSRKLYHFLYFKCQIIKHISKKRKKTSVLPASHQKYVYCIPTKCHN